MFFLMYLFGGIAMSKKMTYMVMIMVSILMVCFLIEKLLIVKNNVHIITSQTKGKMDKDVVVKKYKPDFAHNNIATAPDFNLKTIDNTPIRLSDFHGQSVLLATWATWCGVCEQEMVDLLGLQKDSSPNQLRVLAINMTSEESSINDVVKFVAKVKPNFPVLLDPFGKVKSIYHIHSIPTAYLIDPYGKILHVFKGIVNPKDVLDLLPQS
jgi:peroxiredoxin